MSATPLIEDALPPGWSKTTWGAYERRMFGLHLHVALVHKGRPRGAWNAGVSCHEDPFSLGMRCVERPTCTLAMGAAEEMAKVLHEWVVKIAAEGRS